MSRVELIVTDLDGTLWDGDERPHPATLTALEEVQRRGIPLLVATGRRTRSTRRALARIGSRPPAVLLGGALGRLADGTEFHRQPFSTSEALAVLEVLCAADLEPVVYVEHDGVEVLVSPGCATHPEHLDRLRPSARTVPDLRLAVTEHPVLNLGVVGAPPDRVGAAAAALAAIATAPVQPDRRFGGATLMVGPRGADKWRGVAAFCQRAGIDPGRVLAVGDGDNDVPVLERAAVACVMADGSPAALAHADHVLPPARDGGWARVLDLL